MKSTDNNEKNGLLKELADLKAKLLNLETTCSKYEDDLEGKDIELQQIIDLVPFFIFVKDEDGKYLLVNKSIAEVYGTNVEDLLGKTDADFAKNRREVENFIKDDLKVINSGNSLLNIEEQLTNSKGEIVTLQTTKIPFETIITHKRALLGLSRDVTKQKQKEKDLITAKELAEGSNRLIAAFLDNLSHEIRTPLNGIIGFAALLEDANITAEELELYVELITTSSDRLLKTINDLMDISMIESGQTKIIKNKININEQLEILHAKYNIAAEQKNLRLLLNNEMLNTEAFLKTDKEKFSNIFSYLISNAIKFSKRGTIEFGYNKDKRNNYDGLVFYVKDMGIGIPIDRLGAIFDRFVQSEISNTRTYEGSGLGLSITKSYVEMLGGEIWVKSEEGEGSEFYFSLPFSTDKKEIKPKNSAIAKKLNPKSEDKLNLKILIAEDEVSISLFLKNMLKDINREIIHAKDGREALELYSKNVDVDLILMDIRMPGFDGYEVTRKIRETNKDVKIKLFKN